MKKTNSYRSGGRMKRVAVLLLTVLLCIGFCGCNSFFDLLDGFLGGSDGPGNQETLPPESSIPTQEPQVTEPVGTEPGPTQEATEPVGICGISGTVVASALNIRRGPGTGYEAVGILDHGESVLILEVEMQGKMLWGKIAQGWICMDYVKLETPENPLSVTVTAQRLNVRGGPGTQYDVVGSVTNGQKLQVLYQVTVDGRPWGCTEMGWICMEYVITDQ